MLLQLLFSHRVYELLYLLNAELLRLGLRLGFRDGLGDGFRNNGRFRFRDGFRFGLWLVLFKQFCCGHRGVFDLNGYIILLNE